MWDLVENAMEKTQAEIAQIKDVATNEPLLRNRLIDPEGSVTAVNVTIKLPDGDPFAQDSAMAVVRNMLDLFHSKYEGIETYVSGNAAMSNAFSEASSKDFSTLVPLMFLIIILTLMVATRSIIGTMVSLVVVVFSIMSAMGTGGWVGIQLTAPSASVPIIVMTLAIADSVHILVTILHSMRIGMPKREAIIESIRVNFMPVFITSLTTVIGFLTLNFSDAPPFRDLGNMTAIGMTAAYFFSVTTLPALLAILPMRVKVKASSTEELRRPIDRFGEWVVNNNKRAAWITAAAVLVLSIFAFTNELNDEFVKYFDDTITFRTDTDKISEELTGIYTTEFSIGSGEEGGINNPEYLQKLDEFENWLYEDPDVIHVNTFSEVASRINKSMHGDSLEYYRVPDNREHRLHNSYYCMK